MWPSKKSNAVAGARDFLLAGRRFECGVLREAAVDRQPHATACQAASRFVWTPDEMLQKFVPTPRSNDLLPVPVSVALLTTYVAPWRSLMRANDV